MDHFQGLQDLYSSVGSFWRTLFLIVVGLLVYGVLSLPGVGRVIGFLFAGVMIALFAAALIKGALIILYTPIPGW